MAMNPIMVSTRHRWICTERLILALVLPRSDGHIDDKERSAIEQQLREAGVEEQGRTLVAQAIEQPLDPQRLAQSVKKRMRRRRELYFLAVPP